MVLQLIFNSIVSGLLLALVAVGFNLIFNVTKVFHLAHGSFYIMGAYVFIELKKYFIETTFNFVLLSTFAFVIVVALLSFIVEKLVYQPLSKKNAGQPITLIASLGIYIFFTNVIALTFTNESKFISVNIGNSVVWDKFIIVPIQIVQLLISIIILSVLLVFNRTSLFLKVKAVISEETVASVLGVNSKNIRLFTMILGSILAAISGILKFYDSGISPYTGMDITLSAAVAVIISGEFSIKGTIVASLLIAFLQTLTELFLSAQWKEGITFFLLIVVILWRTEGIVSFRMRIEEK